MEKSTLLEPARSKSTFSDFRGGGVTGDPVGGARGFDFFLYNYCFFLEFNEDSPSACPGGP